MSGIGGIFNFDEAPVEGEILTALGHGLAARGPDGGNYIAAGSVGMVYRAFHTNRESHLERQPLVSRYGHILCWDGRLDNREELIALLSDELHGDQTDVAIVMAGYLKWGCDCFSRIIGEFALSLWDPSVQSVILARDVIGSRDLYYHLNEHHVLWASDLKLLVQQAGIEVEISDEYVAGYLTRLPEPWQSPFKHIDAVAPAHAVIVHNGQLKTQRIWGLNPNLEIRYQSDAEYEEQFRHLFQQAVKCALRADGPVWSDLSGGLDSSSIVCVADRLMKRGETQATKLRTVSCIRDESPSSNETKFIRMVEDYIGRKGQHLPESEFPVFSFVGYEPSVIPNTLDLFVSYHRAVDELMLKDGARVRLCGNGGDEILNSVPDPASELTDLLAQGNVIQLHRRLLAWGRDRKKPYIKLLWHDSILPTLPRRLQVELGHGAVKRLPDWFEQDFVKRTNLRDLMLGPADTFGFALPSSRVQAVNFLCAVRELSAGYVRVLQNVEIRLPMLHRPLVEFMQAIPRDQRIRLGETRSLQRRALNGLVPPAVLKRKGKGNPAEAIFRGVLREHTRLRSLLADAYVARYGYLNQKALTAALQRYRYGDQRAMWLPRIIFLEFWLRSLDGWRGCTKAGAAVMGSPVAQPTAVLEAAVLHNGSTRHKAGALHGQINLKGDENHERI